LIPQSPLSSESVVPLVYTDVNVVPEHESNQLEKSISNLEGISLFCFFSVI